MSPDSHGFASPALYQWAGYSAIVLFGYLAFFSDWILLLAAQSASRITIMTIYHSVKLKLPTEQLNDFIAISKPINLHQMLVSRKITKQTPQFSFLFQIYG